MTAPDGIDPQRWEKACAAAVAARHNFADTTTCQCGYEPDTAADWQRHQVDAALRAALTELQATTKPGQQLEQDAETWWEYGMPDPEGDRSDGICPINPPRTVTSRMVRRKVTPAGPWQPVNEGGDTDG